LALYYASTYFLITKYENIPEANVVGPVRGVLFTLCVVVLVAHADRLARLLGRALSRLRRLRAIAVPAMSYPLHKKFRTGMTLAMFSVVILAIAFFSIVGALFETDPARQTGGFDVEGRTSLDVEDLASFDRGLLPAGLVREEVQILDTASEDPGFITVSGERTGMFGEVYHHVYGYGDDFAAAQGFTLLWRLPEFADDGAAYRAVLERGDAVIVSYQYSTNERNQDLSHGVGETLELHLGDEVEAFTVVGIQEQYHFPGVFLGKERVKALFPHSEQLFLFQLGPGADAGDAAVLLEKNYRGAGLDAKDTVAEVVREQESFRQVLGAMKLFLGLGLVVGVLSLGIVTSRNVLERRQEIGMLRALGYTGRQVRRIFLVEVSFTLLLGALVGLACAIVVTYGLWHAVIRDLRYDYVIPWGEVGILLGVSYVVALLATWAPIGRSAKVAPAEALRYVE
ncbi:MAG TPA: FtsX-like permease family protein, partial [Candidatus Thermoplasmatota archaeon]|nr:FtsX-like permease family protein [Candidatus Thermoplasmatota archaeon]